MVDNTAHRSLIGVAMIGRVKQALGLADLAQFTAALLPKA
jgi:hypothetical protein